jgi:hypothetical protein
LCFGVLEDASEKHGSLQRQPSHMSLLAGLSDLALAGHARVRSFGIHPGACGSIEPGDERLAPVPQQKAGAVHRGIRETPEGIGFVGQKVRGGESIVVRSDGFAA